MIDGKRGSLNSGNTWWKSLKPIEKIAVVKPLLEDGLTSEQAKVRLHLSSKNMIVNVRNQIMKFYPEGMPDRKNGPRSSTPALPRPSRRGAHARQIKERVKRRNEDLARAKVPELQVIKNPTPPPKRPRTREEIIDANIHDMPPPSRGPFIDDPINIKYRAYVAALNSIIYKLIDAGVV